MSTIGYYICVPFAWVLRTFYELTGSYGWALVLFTIVVKLWKKSVVDWKTFLIFLLVFAGSVFLNISPVLYVLAAALAGIVVKELEARKA